MGLAAGAATWALWWEPRRLVARRPELRLPGWPESLDGLRVGMVSDLHAGGPHVNVDRVGRLVEQMNREAPDLVVLLGDYVDPDVLLGGAVSPEAVAGRLGGLQAPLGIFAVLGNHDWAHEGPRIAQALRDAGVSVLENEAAAVETAGAPLWVVGLADLRRRQPELEAALDPVPDRDTVILLSHDPDLFPRVPARVALTLSGHTHGGQVDLPIAGRRIIPSRFGERYAAGHVQEGGRHLLVSTGVGSARYPVRFRVPPEIVVARLLAG